MNPIEQHNLSEIESLNQRGGRTLSFVDLIRAGTMTEEMVAYCWAAIAGGASFLTAARPGGAGKSTVLANLLALLPPGEEILTVGRGLRPAPGEETARDVATAPQCSLAHEIGSGHWYGYIWGEQVREFLNLKSHGHRLAACLHADTLDELTGIFCTPPLSCSSEEVRVFDLILFIHVLPQGRRVVALHEVDGEAHRPVFEWDDEVGQAVLCTQTPADYKVRLAAVHRIMLEGETAFQTVREKVLAEYAH
ncbi:MAG: hypothetical protein ACYC63_15420 [Armatimonadota bacterium]